MTKYWKTDVTRDGKPVRLYVATSEEIITEDLACGAIYSLTLMGRQDNYRRNRAQDTNHVDFATGAFGGAARYHGLQLGKPISEVDSIPDGLQAHHLGGGKDKPFLTAVYEEMVAENS
jgi:hypothetical protein